MQRGLQGLSSQTRDRTWTPQQKHQALTRDRQASPQMIGFWMELKWRCGVCVGIYVLGAIKLALQPASWVWPWAGHLSFLSLSFSICTVGIAICLLGREDKRNRHAEFGMMLNLFTRLLCSVFYRLLYLMLKSKQESGADSEAVGKGWSWAVGAQWGGRGVVPPPSCVFLAFGRSSSSRAPPGQTWPPCGPCPPQRCPRGASGGSLPCFRITAKTGLLRAPPVLCGVRVGLGSSGPSALWCPRTSRQGLPWHSPSALSSDRPPAVAFISQPFHPLPRCQGLIVLFSLLGAFCLPPSSSSFHRSQFKEFFLEEPSFSVRLALCTLVACYCRNSHGAL